jgi:hypothetical protein
MRRAGALPDGRRPSGRRGAPGDQERAATEDDLPHSDVRAGRGARTSWECQLIGAADGQPSRWQPCAGSFSVTVVRDGDHVLRVREAESRDLVDTWEWTVVPEDAGPAAADPAP